MAFRNIFRRNRRTINDDGLLADSPSLFILNQISSFIVFTLLYNEYS